MDDNAQKGLVYCSLLALQFGLQPILASKFTSSSVSKSSVVIATELGKILIALTSIAGGPKADREKIVQNWSIGDSLRVAALPATLYAIQNLLVQYGYIYLDSMTFNLLNQTKTLSAAFWLWVIMGKKQSGMQMVALLLLLTAALVLNMGDKLGSMSFGGDALSPTYQMGVLCVAGASMLSGLSAALTQRALVGAQQRHPLFFSAELAVYGILFLLGNLYFNSDMKGSILSGWDLKTLIPVSTNAFGGLVVGLVTKYAGGVVKGFALIAGIIITGLAQFLIDGKPLGQKDLVGVVLVSVSIYLHSKYPYVEKAKVEKAKKQ
mmetsp:Transcript_6495/g.14318  ORF Transcript_6495/g.14318 Transcript_6495/m.14318 type:complete len:321 (-) Transcript_6495:155-1117(-)